MAEQIMVVPGEQLLIFVVAVLLERARGGIQVTDAEMEDAHQMIEDGGRVLLTSQTELGKAARTTYRLTLVKEGL